MTIQAMYIGEIATDDLRGALGSFMNLGMSIGLFLINCIGPYLSFVATQRVLLLFPCAFVLLFALMPESPYFYVAQNRPEDALKSLSFLQGKSTDELADQLKEIEFNIAGSGEGSGVKELFTAVNLKALTICGVLIAMQQFSGINGISFYASTIFAESGADIDPYHAAIFLSAAQVVTSMIIPFVADKWGRKALLFFSSGTCFLSLLAFTVYAYGTENSVAGIATLTWLPLVALVSYMLFFPCGLASMPWALVSELFAPQVKQIATPIMTVIAWSCTFLIAKFFQPISVAFGTYYVFGFFAAAAAFAFMFTGSVVFETKGLSLSEVQTKLLQSTKKKNIISQ